MSNSKEQRLQVANTILMQLGGRRFSMMTGAKQFVAIDRGLLFVLPARLAKQGINKVRIELEASDTYTVTALTVNARRGDVIEVQCESMVYCEQLEATFERMTGIYTHL
ncbi:hypothetical protein FCV44_04200 [Vibrio kanaloae]|uniref:Uncharacterized protein n=1 Tax=Vibrio sp. FF_307 TaxID=1652834 RepID=A0A0H3ZSD9_9VIBR|nr:hypothetical protein [Vibrio kanaloae]AKN36799.1 hypothetical protein [Vibrio sp. FF_307]TKF00275.1 hypothetical protein FCV44_04200 [Vibrio kanaloae]TKF17798.1 hypothetical protein FCV47_07225 [Vibrio kanaloae]TKF78933.1 hypothetical protein FCV62_10460 [Vibrio kanaloae]